MPMEDMQILQEADFEKLNNLVADVDKQIADLDQQLRPDVLRERERQIRSDSLKELDGLLRTMSERAGDAEKMARTFTKEAELRRARFAKDDGVNATMTLAAFARLQRTPTPELVEHMEDAATTNNLALAETVRLEFRAREDTADFLEGYAAAFDKVQTPHAAQVKATVGKVASLAALGRERFNYATTGRSDPVVRMAAARLAAA